MGMASFNRARRQAEALQDARNRDNEKQNTPLNHRYTAEELGNMSNTPEKRDALADAMASPRYPDLAGLVNIPADADVNREIEAAAQAELNKTRVISAEARDELQNSHLRDEKTKAIPHHDEAGQDRSREGMRPLQEQAYDTKYSDLRVPQRDGRLRATENYYERPDVDVTESEASRTPAVPPVPDDDPKEVGKIIARGNAAAQKRFEDANRFMMVATDVDPKEALQTGGISKLVETQPLEATDPPGPNHAAGDDMSEAGKSAEAGKQVEEQALQQAKQDAEAEQAKVQAEQEEPEKPKSRSRRKNQEDEA